MMFFIFSDNENLLVSFLLISFCCNAKIVKDLNSKKICGLFSGFFLFSMTLKQSCFNLHDTAEEGNLSYLLDGLL